MGNLVIFWHRRDLRLADNLGLAAAAQGGQSVVGLFCWDSALFDRQYIAPASATYAWESIKLLQQDYAAAGSRLWILVGDPLEQIPLALDLLKSKTLHFNQRVEPHQRAIDSALTTQLQGQGVAVTVHEDALLQGTTSVFSGSGTPYTVYTPYWRNWSSRPKPEPVSVNLTPLTSGQRQAIGPDHLPDLAAAQLQWSAPLILAPGNAAAQERLEKFARRAMDTYEGDRNFPALDGTSTLSAALTWGTLGIRTAWQATLEALEQCRGIEDRASVTTWQQELAWREFYYQALWHFPELADGPYRARWRQFPWDDDRGRFELWCAGKTGYPIVDAAMHQLNTTGWMHNRCRMIVASFLTKDLMLNWQWGERYFMQTLIDGDLAANNGGWQWSASSGMDPKPLRIFNPSTQAQKFDPEGDYIRHWLPELKSVPLKDLLVGNIAPLWRSSSGYPEPIVDHKIQQQEFKRRYAQMAID